MHKYINYNNYNSSVEVIVYQILSSLDIRRQLGDILNRVALRHDQFVIKRKGKPLAAMIPVDKFNQMERLAREHLLELLAKQSSEIAAQRQADTLANEAKHQSRKRKPRLK